MTGARRLLWLVIVLALIIAACGPDDEEQRPIDEEQRLIAEQQRITDLENVITPPPATEGASDEEGAGVLEIATLLPIESGRFAGEHWIKWTLEEPIPDPNEFHMTYQVNIRSVESDVYGFGWTIPKGEEPFASGFCLDDRPNCADGTIPVTVVVGPNLDELTFFVPEGTFGEATDLRIFGFIQTFPENGDPITEDVGDGAPIPMGFDERDPC